MDTALIVYEKREQTEKHCGLVARVLGPSVSVDTQNFDGSFDGHDEVAIVFPLEEGRLPKGIAKFIDENATRLSEKRVALICISANRASAARILKSTARRLPKSVVFSSRIPFNERPQAAKGFNDAVYSETCDKMIELRRALAAPSDMPQDMLFARIVQILQSHNTGVLCTGHGIIGRATPVEYFYKDGALYYLSEGGEKFAHLFANPHVFVTVFSEYTGFDKLEGLQMEGTAEMIETFCDEYNSIIASKGFSCDKLSDLPVRLNMFKVFPERIEVLKSDFAKDGYKPKQIWTKKP